MWSGVEPLLFDTVRSQLRWLQCLFPSPLSAFPKELFKARSIERSQRDVPGHAGGILSHLAPEYLRLFSGELEKLPGEREDLVLDQREDDKTK